MTHWLDTIARLAALGDSLAARAPVPPLSEHIQCPDDCGRCCSFPNIDVSVAECLPTAMAVLSGPSPAATVARIEEFAMRVSEKLPCPLFLKINKTDGRCTYYRDRPILCRIYGVTTRKMPKDVSCQSKGHVSLVGCDLLKESLDASGGGGTATPLAKNITDGLATLPDFESILAEVAAINPQLGTVRMPIAKALHSALKLLT